MKDYWRDHPYTDTFFAIVGFTTVWLPAHLVEMKADAFAGAAAAVIAILATVVTFACSSVYQSSSVPIREIRKRHGKQLRQTWIHTVAETSCSAVMALLAIPVTYWSARFAFGVTLAALAVAVAATCRSLDFLNIVYKASATDD